MASGPPSKGIRQLQIGRYQILDRIATGGMGAVYKAIDTKRGREVALKVLPFDTAASKPIFLERFQQEARYGRRLNHENVVSFYKYGKENGIYYLAMEFVDGINLHDYVKQRGKIEVADSLRIMIQATRAIAHLHQHGIIHRDIKPSNFLITTRHGKPWIKLIDLGLARRLSDEARMTMAGSTLGTLDYIAPEQARDARSADIRSDIYSLGCTWYHLLSGRPPFAEGTLTERIYKHMEVEPPDINQFNADVPTRVKKKLARMLAKDPAARYQTPDELLQELEGGKPSAKPAKQRRIPRPVAKVEAQAEVEAGSEKQESLEAKLPVRRMRGGGRQFLADEDEEGEWQRRGRRKRWSRRAKRRAWMLALGTGLVLVIIALFIAWQYLGSGQS